MENNHDDSFYIIRDLETLRVFADPLRAQVFEILAKKPQTVNDVAEKLGLSSSKLYYHFNLMEKHGLIEVVETRLVGNLIEKIYRTVARDLEIDHSLLNFSESGENEGIDEVVHSLLETTREDISRSLQARYRSLAEGAPKVPRRILMNRIQVYLTDEKFHEFEQKLFDLFREFEQADLQTGRDREGVQLFSLAAFLYPSFYYNPPTEEKDSL
jgi:DNA-binding transcriptional ArsR family regulator